MSKKLLASQAGCYVQGERGNRVTASEIVWQRAVSRMFGSVYVVPFWGTRVAGSSPQLTPPPSESQIAAAGAKDVSAKPSSTTRHHQRDTNINSLCPTLSEWAAHTQWTRREA